MCASKGGAEEDDEDEDELEAKRASAAFQAASRPSTSHTGYEFRKGFKTQFPDCKAQPGESEEEAAFRVAAERRGAGVESFNDGTVWGAQRAVDAWGQGLLALERLKNLRRYRPLEAITAQSVAHEAEGGGAEGEATEQQREPAELPVENPTEQEVASLQVTLRLNIAQALLKLRDFEPCITHCDKALELEPTSTKGLWRKAKAVWGMRNPGLAREALGLLLELDEGNAAAIAMLREIDQEEAKKRVRRTGVRGAAPGGGARGGDGAAAGGGTGAGGRATAAEGGPAAAASAAGPRWPCCRRRHKPD